MGYDANNTDSWDFVTWDASTPRRITQLNLENKQLIDVLDVSGLTNLVSLSCFNNILSGLNVSGLTNMSILQCDNNFLTTLDLSTCSGLRGLACTENALTSLTLPTSASLINLYCSDNMLVNLDVSSFSQLAELGCSDNLLMSLDVAGLTNLEYLDCDNNFLESLDLTGLTSLTELYCAFNLIPSLDLQNTPNLEYLIANHNNLSSINVTGLSWLTRLDIESNPLSSLNLTDLDYLEEIWFDYRIYGAVTLPNGNPFPHSLTVQDNKDVMYVSYLLAADIFSLGCYENEIWRIVGWKDPAGMNLTGDLNQPEIGFTMAGPASVSPIWYQYGALAENNTISVPKSIYAATEFTITAAGDKQAGALQAGQTELMDGEERYIPLLASVNPTATFTLNADGQYTAPMTLPSGTHTLTVTFQRQYWDGTQWLNWEADWGDDTDTKTLQLTVHTAPKTSDTAAPGLWLAAGGLSILGLLVLLRKRKTA